MSKHHGDPEVRAKLLTLRRFGLLDDDGRPVANADAKLAVAQAEAKVKKRERAAKRLSLSPPRLKNGQQVQQPVVDLTQAQQPLYSTQPEQPATNLPHLNQPMTPALSTPATIAGYKRSREETDIEDANIEAPLELKSEAPPLKRQQLEDGKPASPHSVTAAPPRDTSIDMQDIEMQHGLPEYNSTADFDGLSGNETNVNVDKELDAFYEGQETGNSNPVSNAAEHAEIKSAEAKVEDHASDSGKSIGSSGSLFGNPEETRRSKTPPSPSVSPKTIP
ncbi:hypothetical protein O1611_g9113 [Lasiodiplodia mahajangana]|uniref:Uncharacterized protein n=1 Tax=Lasiodiplodia mahajangana TaxID=1108764 RepID=A0ACC2JB73_9PEZI|nr:hypothetical protein O1611_g9113 [Lasiodiplodia mahajangana]